MEHGSGNSGRKPSWLTGRGILIAVMFLLGLGIFLYPHICDWYYQYQFNKAIAAYDRFQGIDCEGMIQAARREATIEPIWPPTAATELARPI